MVSQTFLNLDLVLRLNQPKKQTEEVIKDCKALKIGKTGQKLNDRFRSYTDKYNDITQLTYSSNHEVVSYIEAELIRLYKDDNRCDNERGCVAGFKDDMADYATTSCGGNYFSSGYD